MRGTGIAVRVHTGTRAEGYLIERLELRCDVSGGAQLAVAAHTVEYATPANSDDLGERVGRKLFDFVRGASSGASVQRFEARGLFRSNKGYYAGGGSQNEFVLVVERANSLGTASCRLVQSESVTVGMVTFARLEYDVSGHGFYLVDDVAFGVDDMSRHLRVPTAARSSDDRLRVSGSRDWVPRFRLGGGLFTDSAATGAPVVRGIGEVGETLWADVSGIADDDGLSGVEFSYRWKRTPAAIAGLASGTVDIAGATSELYRLVDADSGAEVSVEVGFADDVGVRYVVEADGGVNVGARASFLVSNLGTAVGAGVDGGGSVGGLAQSFSTGTQAAALEAVRLRLGLVTGGVSVSVYSDAGGAPDTSLETLSAPSVVDGSAGTAEDFASTGLALAAGTTYWVVVTADPGTVTADPGAGAVSVGSSSVTDEDAAPAAGWSVGDSYSSRSGTAWTAQTATGAAARVLAVGVRGTAMTAPEFGPSVVTALTVREDASDGDTVGTVTAVDPDGDTLTHSVGGADATAFGEDFALDAATGTITVRAGATLDHETKPSYSVVVSVTDGKDSSGATETVATVDDSVEVSVSVSNAEEAGLVTLSAVTPEVGTALTATLTDPDRVATGPTWQWSKSNTSGGTFADISGATSGSYAPVAEDVGKYLKAAASYSDGHGSGKTAESTSEMAVMQEVDLPDVTVQFGAAAYPASEGGNATVEVSLSADPERTVVIPITVTNQGGATSADYSGVPASVTFNPRETLRSFVFEATQDSHYDGGESVTLTFGTLPAEVTEGTTAQTTISITDDGIPAAVANLDATPGDQFVTLNWDDPENSSITNYQYRYRVTSAGAWNRDWTDIPGSSAPTASYTVTGLTNNIDYTFEIRVVIDGVEGAEANVAATPIGPPAPPGKPLRLNVAGRNEMLAASWSKPSDEDEPAPVTTYQVRYRRVGTSSWTNVSRSNDDLNTHQRIPELTNQVAYEVQVRAVNRIGGGAWASTKGTPQAPPRPAPGPAGDEAFNVGRLGAFWADPEAGGNTLQKETCTGAQSFRIIWAGPDNDTRPAEWDAHVVTREGAGTVSYNFEESEDSPGYHEMQGTVNLEGSSSISIRVRGRFGVTWGKWSPPVGLYCFETAEDDE